MDYLSSWCSSKRRLEGYTAIVTGSNTGLGRETALDFYFRGARVIMACLDVTIANAAKKEMELEKDAVEGRGTLVVEELDLSSFKSIREFSLRILANEASINILVNNAGVMCCPEGTTEDGFESQIGTNHYGHSLLTLLLLPRLIKSAPSRIVFVSSFVHSLAHLDLDEKNFQKLPYNALIAYSASKAANILFARVLAEKLKEHDINDVTTYSLHPGVINTEIGKHFSSTICYGATWLFQNVMSWFMKSPRCGAQTTIYCAVDEACANESGLYYQECAVSSPSSHCQDGDVAAKLWDQTIASLNLGYYNPFGGVDPDRNIIRQNSKGKTVTK